MLAKTGLDSSKLLKTPMVSCSLIPKYDGTPLTNPSLYRNFIRALKYCVITKFEIAFIVNRSCQFFYAPTEYHWNATKRILRYLKGSELHGILYWALLGF